jgi:hypothetical protein
LEGGSGRETKIEWGGREGGGGGGGFFFFFCF